jgi:two-component system sensor histidine kinase KdpD
VAGNAPEATRRLLRAGLSAAAVVGISLAETTIAHVNQTTAALTLLLAVLAIATGWGLVESLAASVAGIVCFNVLFLPPVGRLTIAATENWVAFVTFVVTAVVASELSSTAKRRAREAARRQLKSAMLDAVAHEFKTPLTAIKAAVTSLLSAAPAAERRELLEIVDEETDRLTSMVTEAIQVARIEAGRIELRKEAGSIASVIQEALSRMKTSLESRAVEVQAAPTLPAVAADRELLLIVLRQLLDNAVKYSPPDSPIVIRAGVQDQWMEVTVADGGPGLTRSEARRVFDEFYRGSAAAGRVPGSGMGLAIARRILQAHGGDIRVQSRPGQGSEFQFRLPLVREGSER